MELFQKGLGEHATRFWQHYGPIDKCPDCDSELEVVSTSTDRVLDLTGGPGFRTKFISKKCTSCPTLSREIYPLDPEEAPKLSDPELMIAYAQSAHESKLGVDYTLAQEMEKRGFRQTPDMPSPAHLTAKGHQLAMELIACHHERS